MSSLPRTAACVLDDVEPVAARTAARHWDRIERELRRLGATAAPVPVGVVREVMRCLRAEQPIGPSPRAEPGSAAPHPWFLNARLTRPHRR